ncbi:MAG: FecR family protein [Lachnospiraceae bacterium]|nr:FecR family protein [Lachnospiraceae bacterium]
MKGKKGILIGAIAAVVIIAAVVVILLLNKGKSESYRVIKVYESQGESIVTRTAIGDITAYSNMLLESGDDVAVRDGKLTLQLDDDKFVYAEKDTNFALVASGSSQNSKTSIELKTGAITNEIQNPLSKDSSYEVNTPNSTMAVRGTVFRVEVTWDADGKPVTKLSGFQGKVDIYPIAPDGTKGEPVSVIMGEEIIIAGEGEDLEIGEVEEINYEELPAETLLTVYEIIGETQSEEIGLSEVVEEIEISVSENSISENSISENSVSENAVEEIPEGPFTVTFTYQGSTFYTVSVKGGETVSPPTLAPAPSGGWDFDFSTMIVEDTIIEWQ